MTNVTDADDDDDDGDDDDDDDDNDDFVELVKSEIAVRDGKNETSINRSTN